MMPAVYCTILVPNLPDCQSWKLGMIMPAFTVKKEKRQRKIQFLGYMPQIEQSLSSIRSCLSGGTPHTVKNSSHASQATNTEKLWNIKLLDIIHGSTDNLYITSKETSWDSKRQINSSKVTVENSPSKFRFQIEIAVKLQVSGEHSLRDIITSGFRD